MSKMMDMRRQTPTAPLDLDAAGETGTLGGIFGHLGDIVCVSKG